MSTTLLMIHILFIVACAGLSYGVGWMRGAAAGMNFEREKGNSRVRD